mmetsp:Transcript_3765/g.12562  ORF Transcript_3765/g.12562 Transcript_3765/m.12562 type:complete len:88 (-) Transcript_3765:809-1072(-)
MPLRAGLLRTFSRAASSSGPGHSRWTTYTTSPYEQKVMQGLMEEFKKGFIRDGPDYIKDIGPAAVMGTCIVYFADSYFHHEQLSHRF